jgi:hypothetical protein
MTSNTNPIIAKHIGLIYSLSLLYALRLVTAGWGLRHFN